MGSALEFVRVVVMTPRFASAGFIGKVSLCPVAFLPKVSGVYRFHLDIPALGYPVRVILLTIMLSEFL